MTYGTVEFNITINSGCTPMGHGNIGTLKTYSMITCENEDVLWGVVAHYACFFRSFS